MAHKVGPSLLNRVGPAPSTNHSSSHTETSPHHLSHSNTSNFTQDSGWSVSSVRLEDSKAQLHASSSDVSSTTFNYTSQHGSSFNTPSFSNSTAVQQSNPENITVDGWAVWKPAVPAEVQGADAYQRRAMKSSSSNAGSLPSRHHATLSQSSSGQASAYINDRNGKSGFQNSGIILNATSVEPAISSSSCTTSNITTPNDRWRNWSATPEKDDEGQATLKALETTSKGAKSDNASTLPVNHHATIAISPSQNISTPVQTQSSETTTCTSATEAPTDAWAAWSATSDADQAGAAAFNARAVMVPVSKGNVEASLTLSSRENVVSPFFTPMSTGQNGITPLADSLVGAKAPLSTATAKISSTEQKTTPSPHANLNAEAVVAADDDPWATWTATPEKDEGAEEAFKARVAMGYGDRSKVASGIQSPAVTATHNTPSPKSTTSSKSSTSGAAKRKRQAERKAASAAVASLSTPQSRPSTSSTTQPTSASSGSNSAAPQPYVTATKKAESASNAPVKPKAVALPGKANPAQKPNSSPSAQMKKTLPTNLGSTAALNRLDTGTPGKIQAKPAINAAHFAKHNATLFKAVKVPPQTTLLPATQPEQQEDALNADLKQAHAPAHCGCRRVLVKDVGIQVPEIPVVDLLADELEKTARELISFSSTDINTETPASLDQLQGLNFHCIQPDLSPPTRLLTPPLSPITLLNSPETQMEAKRLRKVAGQAVMAIGFKSAIGREAASQGDF